VTRYYVPAPGNPHFSIEQAGPALQSFTQVYCADQNRTSRGVKGDATLEVLVGADGNASRAEITHGTGDEALDGLFGTFGAQLTFAAPANKRELTRQVHVHYECASPVVTTVEVERS
jgi:hypothetical protein